MRDFLHIKRAATKMSIDNMIFNDECLPAKTGKKRRMPLSPFSFNVVLEILTSTIKLVKEIKIA